MNTSFPRAIAGRVRAQARTIGPVPRALLRGTGLRDVRAQAQPPVIKSVEDLTNAFEAFKAKHEDRYNQIEAALDDDARRRAGEMLNGGGGDGIPIDKEYTTAFASYFRKGAGDAEANLRSANAEGVRATIQAAMSVGDNSSGGYLAPVEWDRRISKAQTAKSPMRRLAQVQPTSVGAYSTLWNNDAWGSGWVGETAARPATSSTSLSPLTFAAGEIYAMPAATQRLLDDAAVNLEDWLAAELEEEFNRQEGIAFISGNGVNKPYGLLQYVTGGAAETVHPGGVLSVAPSGHASQILADSLVDFAYGLPAPYRQNASWLMSSPTAAFIAKMKDGQGNFLWRESFVIGQPATLLGRPVEIDENMPPIAANALSVAFGDFRAGYLINDRLGTRVLRDPFSNKPFVLFYATKRVGAGVADPKAIRLMKVAAA